MKFLPQFFVYNSPWPNRVGAWVGRPKFYAMTLGFWTLVDDEHISIQQKVHEYRHIVQWFVLWVGAFTWWFLTHDAAPLWQDLLMVVITSLTIIPFYTVAGIWAVVTWSPQPATLWWPKTRKQAFYRNNWFERNARSAAGEH